MINLSAETPKRSDRAIVLSDDEKFSPNAFALIKQMVDHLPELDADFCLVSEAPIAVPQQLSYLPIRYCHIAIAKDGIQFPVTEQLTFATYLRLFAVTALAHDYERIVYFDSDFFYARGDVTVLFDMPLCAGDAIGAVRDIPQQLDLDACPREATALGLATFPYFNAGLMVVDTKAWLAQDIFARALKIIKDTPAAIVYHDQSAVNLVLQGQWAELSYHWNFLYSRRLHLPMRILRPAFLHFVGPGKPWFRDPPFVPSEAVTWYTSFLATYYPDLVPPRYDQTDPIKSFYALRLIKYGIRSARERRPYFRRLLGARNQAIAPKVT